ncbi:hypothetical protein [Kitasatospora sp. NPDC094011]|uniref:hypothetical protein n=1 Tax=Kitasatospora sp. NPDC094011 TaxID=3364090 RepID=UPI0038193B87
MVVSEADWGPKTPICPVLRSSLYLWRSSLKEFCAQQPIEQTANQNIIKEVSMKRRQRALCGSVVTFTVASLLLGAAPASSADSGGQRAANAAAVVERATGTTDLAASSDASSVPATSVRPVTAAAGADQITVTLPATSAVPGVRAGTGTVVYPGASAGGKADLAVQPTRNGGIRALVTIGTADAALDYRFDLGLPDGAALEQQADGSVNVVKNGEALGAFAAPWAKDANGTPVPTSYRLDGNTLVQHIDTRPDTAYPVVADPFWDTTWKYTKCVAAVAAAFVPAGKAFSAIKGLGGVAETVKLLWGASKASDFLAIGGSAAAEILGISSIQTNCF